MKIESYGQWHMHALNKHELPFDVAMLIWEHMHGISRIITQEARDARAS